ncbi:topoisomerase 1-associated factor 1 [Acrodontium crateriforme]|uniref:Topoisomerase 1-associated factor 1 n=1 Tax=Acrodontium crateriforme TaxID=150365 RepID=A0AAQ3M3J4_9PEZI|nr:topoisomerase 1-associated factor 1 [Acrodontium crateriforme]
MEVWEKSQTVDPEVRAYVLSLVNAVGGSSTYDDSYAIGDDAAGALQDLLRWLRLYDEKFHRYDVKRCLAEANLVKGDLLEILAQLPEDPSESRLKGRLAILCLQLLVPLSWPPELDPETFHNDRFTVNNSRHLPYLQLAQVGYKRNILHFENAQILRTAVRVALPAMAEPRRERTPRNEGIIKLVLYLLRNLAFITQPQHLPSQGDENEISRSSTIDVFHQQDVFMLLLTLGSSANDEFQDQDVVLLEVLYHLLKGVDATKLFLDEDEVAEKETNELQLLMEKEKAMLSGYRKHAPSRHNRFGTMIWVKRGDDKLSTVSGQSNIVDDGATLQNMDASKKWNKPKYRGKMNLEENSEPDFGKRIELTQSARNHLRGFVEDFLDSSFNPLFSNLRKAIERQADRVGSIHIRQYFYVATWFLAAETARREKSQRMKNASNGQTEQTVVEENSFAYIAAVLDQETFVLLNRNLQRTFDEKNWQDLQAVIMCFTQILLTVQAMAESKDEEDQEIADNIQSRIFYEETTHDLIVRILRGYTHQGFAYLDTITECVHVFVRMLERYSKQNVDLHIRSKRRARKKRQLTNDGQDHGQNDAEEDAEDEREAHVAVSERKFDFARFSARFLSQGCVDTFIAFTHFYQELSGAQLKRCHRFFYRLAFKQELAVLLYRVDILQLFHRMIKGQDCLSSSTDGFRDWEQLVQQVFRRCIKWVERESEGEGWRGAAIVEMLFSKIPNTLFYLQNGYELVAEKKTPRAPAELQVKASVADDQKIPVAVSLLIDKGKFDALTWIKAEFARAIELLQTDENTAAGLKEMAEKEGPTSEFASILDTEDQRRKNETILVNTSTTNQATLIRELLFRDKYVRLLMKTLGMERLGADDDLDATWIFPRNTTAEDLHERLDQIQQTEFNPPTFDDGKNAEDMIRNQATGRRGATFSEDEDDGTDSGGEINESLFPPNLREQRVDGERPVKRRRLKPRNKTELTEDQAAEKAKERRKKEQERNSKIKSALYITAEDDESDEERDQEFFRLEEERRKKTAGVIRRTLHKEAKKNDEEKGIRKDKKRKNGADLTKKTKRQKQIVLDDDNDEMDLYGGIISDDSKSAESSHSDNEDEDVESVGGVKLGAIDISDAELDDSRSASATSPLPLSARKATAESIPLSSVSGNARSVVAAADSDDDDDAPVVKPVARRSNVRAGFLLDDSDSERGACKTWQMVYTYLVPFGLRRTKDDSARVYRRHSLSSKRPIHLDTGQPWDCETVFLGECEYDDGTVITLFEPPMIVTMDHWQQNLQDPMGSILHENINIFPDPFLQVSNGPDSYTTPYSDAQSLTTPVADFDKFSVTWPSDVEQQALSAAEILQDLSEEYYPENGLPNGQSYASFNINTNHPYPATPAHSSRSSVGTIGAQSLLSNEELSPLDVRPNPTQHLAQSPPLSLSQSTTLPPTTATTKPIQPRQKRDSTSEKPPSKQSNKDLSKKSTSPTRTRRRPRIPHTDVERRYRENLNAHLDKLRTMVPGHRNSAVQGEGIIASDALKLSKCEVISAAVSHIGNLERENSLLGAEVKELKALVLNWERRSAGAVWPI